MMILVEIFDPSNDRAAARFRVKMLGDTLAATRRVMRKRRRFSRLANAPQRLKRSAATDGIQKAQQPERGIRSRCDY